MRTANNKEVLTTGEVARICHVAPRTVSKWFDTGKLRGYRIPGSRDRRIPVERLVAFMRAHGIPLSGLDGGTCRLLIIDGTTSGELSEALAASERYEVRTAANGFDAGLVAQQFHPHVMVLDVDSGLETAGEICRNVKSHEELQSVKVVAAGTGLDAADRQCLLEAGFDDCLAKPYALATVIRVIEDATSMLY